MQLVALFTALLSCLATKSHADQSGEVTTRYQLYADDDATTVSTVILDASIQGPLEVQVAAHLLIDVVSSASIDVVSAATEGWTEARAEAGARMSKELAGVDLGLGFTRSQEEDWASSALQLGVGRDFLQRNLRLEASFGRVWNRIGRAADPVFEEQMQTYFAELGLSQLLDKKSRVGLSYGLQHLRGYQASPYRYVLADDGTRMPETHPSLRTRHSVSAYALRSLKSWLTGRMSYRYYLDDWGVRSHTGEVRIRADLGKHFYLQWRTRVYQQGDAAFYRKHYTQALAFMTNDRELSRFWNIGSSVSVGAKVGPLLLDAKVGLTHYSFKNFEALPNRLALVTGLGANLPW